MSVGDVLDRYQEALLNEFVYTAENESATERLGSALAKLLPNGSVIGMIGVLGAGKTRLVRAVAEALGVPKNTAGSPTFVLIHEYCEGVRPVYHFDTYRLRDSDEFIELGPYEYFDSDGLSFVEWADRVEEILPTDRIEIQIDLLDETKRLITIRTLGDAAPDLIFELQKELS